jgi:hypothetical protein
MNTLIMAAIRCSLMFTAAAAFCVAHPAKANLITNGGFETGDLSGWTVSGAVSVGGTFPGFPPPHSGNFQAFLEPSGGSLAQTLATTPGQSYTIDFWLANLPDQKGNNSFTVTWGGVPIFSLLDANPFDYTEYTFNVTATSASTALQFDYTQITDLYATWLLDDVSVNPAGVGVPDGGSTLPLLGFALLGLAALRRKLRC